MLQRLNGSHLLINRDHQLSHSVGLAAMHANPLQVAVWDVEPVADAAVDLLAFRVGCAIVWAACEAN